MKWGVMGRDLMGRVALAAVALAVAGVATPAAAQVSAISVAEGVHAGEVAVPVNKSQVIRSDRPYAKALIGNPEIADVLPLTDRSLYVLGKKMGTTSLTLYDRSNMLIAVVDVVVGPDVISLRRQLSELMPVEGSVPGSPMNRSSSKASFRTRSAADRAVQIAESLCSGQGHQPAVDRIVAAGHARSPLLGDQALRAQANRRQLVLRKRRRQASTA